jgi:hypothetical protein
VSAAASEDSCRDHDPKVSAVGPASQAGWKSQHFCPAGQLPTGAGKSIIFAVGFFFSRKTS